MWKTVAKEEKRVKELLENARRRAQRRKAYYDSRLGDPMQLLRVSGSATKLVTSAESYAFNEDPKNLMPWPSDPSVRIDRFDGRALLDFLPTDNSATVESGLRIERDEDGIGNELRFERWFDLVDKMRLHVSEEQCLAENEEEWNDLVARHHALIGKTPEKQKDKPDARPSFAFNYGTATADTSGDQGTTGALADVELTPLEEDNILEHLDELTPRDRDFLDSLGQEYQIDDYFRMLRRAQQEQIARVNHMKMTAVNLERAMAGKKPLKAAEIEGLDNSWRQNGEGRNKRRRRRGRSNSPHRRSSPSYEPYSRSSSRSGSESPVRDSLPFMTGMAADPMASNPPTKAVEARKLPPVSPASAKILGVQPVAASPAKLSLAEKLKQRMRQGLDQSIKSQEMKRQAKEKGIDFSTTSAVDMDYDVFSSSGPAISTTSPSRMSGSKEAESKKIKEDKRKSRSPSRGRSQSRSQSRSRSRSKSRSRSRERKRSGSASPRRRSHGGGHSRHHRRSRSRSAERGDRRSRHSGRRSRSRSRNRSRSRDRTGDRRRSYGRSLSRSRSRSRSRSPRRHSNRSSHRSHSRSGRAGHRYSGR